ncbi:MAG: signal peptidase I [Prevotella sp.]|nr:signal peptidase I [Prevotella sp.]
MKRTQQILVILSIVLMAPFFMYGAWLFIRMFVMDLFIIPSTSMMPTLMPGDKIVVDKTIMGARIYSNFDFNPKGGKLACWRTNGVRGLRVNDIIVFNYPLHRKHISFVINNVYCKRCIALPGDSLSVVKGHFINNNYAGVLGHKESQDALSLLTDSISMQMETRAYPHDKHLPWTIFQFGPIYIPRKNDIIRITPREACLYKAILEWETQKKIKYDWEKGSVLADGKEFTSHRFLHNYYFVAGDNVQDSRDSRYWGLLPEDYIVGVVRIILYSVDSQTNMWRSNRWLKKI